MTYESSASKARYAGNGVATAFPTPFTFVDNGHVKCVFSVGNTSGGYDETPLVEGVDYSLTGAGSENGGTITFPLPGSAYAVLASSQFLTCYLKPPISQSTNLSNAGSIDLEVHEAAFDKLTMICQSLQEQVDRAVLYPVSADQNNILDSSSFLDATTENKTAAAASALAASTSADHAATSEANAAGFAQAADASADAAATSAAEAAETISSGLPDATTTIKGKVRFATASEVASGTAGGAVSPVDLKTELDKKQSPAVVGAYTRQQYAVPVAVAPVAGAVTLDAELHQEAEIVSSVALTMNAPTNAVKGMRLFLRLYAATALAISWNAVFKANADVALPAAHVAGKGIYLDFRYDGAAWVLMGKVVEA